MNPEGFKKQLILLLKSDSNIKNYTPISFTSIDTTFILEKEKYELLLQYFNGKDTVAYTQEEFMKAFKDGSFVSRENEFISQNIRLLKPSYAGIGYKLEHKLLNDGDTNILQLATDTNWNILRKVKIK